MKKLSSLLCLCVLITLAARAGDPEENTGLLKGKVTTTDDKPAAFVTVELKESKKSIVTEEDGTFILRGIRPGAYHLQISLVGYEPLEQEVVIEKNKTTAVSLQLKLSEKQLEEVVVSSGRNRFARKASDYAAKMPLSNLENAQVYSVVTKDLLQEQSVFNVADALKNVPGISKLWDPVYRAGDGGAYMTSRGFYLQSQLRNGVAGNVTGSIDGANIESIEVLKGPSATLFGSSLTSYGGLINRITKKPYDKSGGEISYAGGSYGFNRISADMNTPLDSAHNVLFRLNTSYTKENSFQDFGLHKNFMVAPSLSYKVNDRLSFSFDAEIFKGENTSPEIIYFYTPVAGLGVSSADQLGINFKRSFMSNDIVVNSGNANFFGQMKYVINHHWQSQTNVSVTTSNSSGPMPYFYLLTKDTLSRMYWNNAGSDNAAEIQQNVIGDFNLGTHRNRLVAGLDYYSYSINSIYRERMGTSGGTTMFNLFDLVSGNGVNPNYLNFNKAKIDSVNTNSTEAGPYTAIYKNYTYSAYVSDVLNITDHLLTSASLRIDHFSNKGNYDPASGASSGAYDQTQLSPKFGLVYQLLNESISLFGNYQNGFTNENGTDYSGKTFQPEQANQWEGGVKMNTLGGRLNGTFSYYDIRVKNVLRTDALHPTFSIQDGTQSSKGFEAEVIANPVSGLSIVAGYAYNDSKYTKVDPDVEGRRPITAGPQNQANAWISYRFSTGAMKGFGIGLGGNYGGVNTIQNSVSAGVFTLPSYTVFNAALFYNQPKYRLSLKGDNLGNKEYFTGFGTITPQKLRSVTASIAFKF